MEDKIHFTKKEIVESLDESSTTKSKGISLQPRDYEILKFILEQKFASLEMIYFCFFDTREDEKASLPKNFWTVRQRLMKLKSVALVKTEKVLSTGKAHYLLTPVGFKMLKGYLEKAPRIKPTKSIDFSLFEHDSRLSMIRCYLEKRRKTQEWYSEKWLKGNDFFVAGHYHKFSKELIPDAVFYNSKYEKVALELEMSRKGDRRIREKIHLYEGLLREHERFMGSEGRPRILDKVWIVATEKSILERYRRTIYNLAENPFRYRLDHYDSVIPECAR